jgi:phosphoribosylformylglycinamidine synthase
VLLFSESNSRFVVTVPREKRKEFEETMNGCKFAHVGFVVEASELRIRGLKKNYIIEAGIEDLRKAWKSTLEVI